MKTFAGAAVYWFVPLVAFLVVLALAPRGIAILAISSACWGGLCWWWQR